MNPTVWITALILVVLFVVLVRELVSPATAMIGAVITAMLTRVAEPEVVLSGFASTATATVAGLFVVARALQRHAGIDGMLQRRLDATHGDRRVLATICAPVSFISSVVANTPLVAALAPITKSWADRQGRPASRVLMPLSFAAILGGTATTIGTSTTLVASGVIERHTGTPFSLLEVTPLGLPLAILGTILLIVIAPWLLPERGETRGPIGQRAYSFRMVVEHDGPLDGVALSDAGLRGLDEVFVAAIDRGAAGVAPARPDSRLAGGDVLVIVGNVDHVRGLPTAGVHHADEGQVAELDDVLTGLHEVVVGRTSPLQHRTLKQASFRGRYGAAVLAINRSGELVEGKLGQVTLQAGDSLLVQAGPGFAERWRASNDFALVAPLDDVLAPTSPRRTLVLAITVGMVLAAGFGVLTLLEAVLWACVALIATGTLQFRDALESLDVDVLLIIAAAIGIGGAVESSGLAALVADGVDRFAETAGASMALLALLVVTTLLTEIVTNVASAAMMVPIALAAAERVGQDPRGWAVAIAICASSSFLTPIGYQTNTIVYGLGGYRFGDYWRLGLPLVALTISLSMFIVPMVWG